MRFPKTRVRRQNANTAKQARQAHSRRWTDDLAVTSLSRRLHSCTLSTSFPIRFVMSSKRKWDQAAPEADEADGPSAKATKVEEGKTASEAAAAAAAIAAKIAAQFASSGGATPGNGTKDPHDGEFTHDIDINDIRNRYLLTKGSTQQQVR